MMIKANQRFKIFTHDWKSPIQGGEPLNITSFPHILPKVSVDISSNECGEGWNYTKTLIEAVRIVGYWPTGRPAQITVVQPLDKEFERGRKCRTAQLEIIRLATETEIKQSMLENIQQWIPESLYNIGVEEQWNWYIALGRPNYRKLLVQNGLIDALSIRGLSQWQLKQYTNAGDARVAWDTWDGRDGRAARDAWDVWGARAARDIWAAQDAWNARAARDAWDVWDVWGARAARAARDIWAAQVAWNARAARDAWDVWDVWGARAARAARDIWAAQDAWNARAARDAWDVWDVWGARAARAARDIW